jgi:nucleoside-diphosphate-sugar epimerase
MKSVLITGATGFIGNALANFLGARGCDVHVVVRSQPGQVPAGRKVHLYDGNVPSLTAALEQAKPDVVFHMASLFLADHRPDQVSALIGSNLLFGTQLLEAMSLTGAARLVNAGTSWQHFGTQAYRPVNLYAATKQAFEDIVAYYHDARALSCVSLKLFDTYGPGDTRRKLVNLLIDAAASQQRLDMSPGLQVVDLTYIDDVVAAFAMAGERLLGTREPCLANHFVSGDRLTVRELVGAVESALGRQLQVSFGGRPYREREVMLPVDADARLLPGWEKKHDLREGLRATAGLT